MRFICVVNITFYFYIHFGWLLFTIEIFIDRFESIDFSFVRTIVPVFCMCVYLLFIIIIITIIAH